MTLHYRGNHDKKYFRNLTLPYLKFTILSGLILLTSQNYVNSKRTKFAASDIFLPCFICKLTSIKLQITQVNNNNFHIICGRKTNKNILWPRAESRDQDICRKATKIESVPKFLIGHGYDIHKLSNCSATGPLIIGGVTIDNDLGFGLIAHSDGDVAIHSICDAIFGALGLEDIGAQYPDTDPKWKNASSEIFLRESSKRIAENGYSIANIDVNVILQKPKLSPFKIKMRKNLSQILGIPYSRVNVKARTHEDVGSIGKCEALECHAVVLLEKLE